MQALLDRFNVARADCRRVDGAFDAASQVVEDLLQLIAVEFCLPVQAPLDLLREVAGDLSVGDDAPKGRRSDDENAGDQPDVPGLPRGDQGSSFRLLVIFK